jgi:glucose-specific phosphotransferase system IIA component
MKLANKIKHMLSSSGKTGEEVLHAPLEGRVIPINQVPDETFATRILGDGIAILPLGGTLFCPADARVDQAFETAHALTLITDGGAELLLHIGIDTVELQGRYFELLVKAGDRVRAGDALIRFDRSAIATADYDVCTPMIISNIEDYHMEVLTSGDVKVGTPLIKLKRKEQTT